MSELQDLININKNIEKQNDEIICLLKKIAGEDDIAEVEEEVEKIHDNLISSLDVGEIFFIDEDIFKLSIKNNKKVIKNLTGNGEATNFNESEIVAFESIKRNQSIDDSTVILTSSCKGKLSDIMKLCHGEGAKNIFLPKNQMIEIMPAFPELSSIFNINFYADVDDLTEKIFKL